MKWCRESRCSPRVRPVCRGNFLVASRVPSTVLHFKTERGTSLETLSRARASSRVEAGTSGFSPFLTLIAGSLQGWDRRVRPRLV